MALDVAFLYPPLIMMIDDLMTATSRLQHSGLCLQVEQTLDGKANLKLYDLGLADVATNTLHAICGTPTYMAPEMIRGAGYLLYILAP